MSDLPPKLQQPVIALRETLNRDLVSYTEECRMAKSAAQSTIQRLQLMESKVPAGITALFRSECERVIELLDSFDKFPSHFDPRQLPSTGEIADVARRLNRIRETLTRISFVYVPGVRGGA